MHRPPEGVCEELCDAHKTIRRRLLRQEAKRRLANKPPTMYLPVGNHSGAGRMPKDKPSSSVTDYERLERIAARLASLFNGERVAADYVPACATLYGDLLKDIGRGSIAEEGGPSLKGLLKEAKAFYTRPPIEDSEEELEDDHPAMQWPLPPDDFFFEIGYLAYSSQDELRGYEKLQEMLANLVDEKAFRKGCQPVFFSLCILTLEKMAVLADPECSSNDYVEFADRLLNDIFYYLYERTDVRPSQMLVDNALRLMHSIAKVTPRPKYWPLYLRIFVTRCLQTRELPFAIQEMCYKLTCQAAWIIGPRFWTADEQFVRVLGAMCAVHWRLMLEGLAEREPLVSAYSLFLEIFLVCEERNRISDQSAIVVASNCKSILESIAGYIKGEDQNPQPLRDGESSIVTALLSTLVSTGAFQMIHEDDVTVIVDWWLKRSLEQSDVFRQLMLCSSFIPKLDARIMGALAAYYERCVTGDVPDEEADMMVFHWVIKLIQEKRTDFYDKASLSDCVARLERVRTPKKYVDALKKLKC